MCMPSADYTANVQTPILTGDYDDNMPVALKLKGNVVNVK